MPKKIRERRMRAVPTARAGLRAHGAKAHVLQWYSVQNGTVGTSYIRARDSSSGHWHGSADTNQLHLPARVGTLVPPTGTIAAGSWATQWRVPEVSNEVSFTFNVTEIGGPNNGQTDWFYSLQNDADRYTGLHRIGPGTGHYRRTGGTATHPEAFNDWATDDIISRIQKADSAYWSKTKDSTLVNDVSLFYGGKFDVGRSTGGTLHDCTDTATQYCWVFSHYEHRIGTEVDIKNKAWADSAGKRVTFLNTLKGEFVTVFIEGNHYHARGAGSPYPVKK